MAVDRDVVRTRLSLQAGSCPPPTLASRDLCFPGMTPATPLLAPRFSASGLESHPRLPSASEALDSDSAPLLASQGVQPADSVSQSPESTSLLCLCPHPLALAFMEKLQDTLDSDTPAGQGTGNWPWGICLHCLTSTRVLAGIPRPISPLLSSLPSSHVAC